MRGRQQGWSSQGHLSWTLTKRNMLIGTCFRTLPCYFVPANTPHGCLSCSSQVLCCQGPPHPSMPRITDATWAPSPVLTQCSSSPRLPLSPTVPILDFQLLHCHDPGPTSALTHLRLPSPPDLHWLGAAVWQGIHAHAAPTAHLSDFRTTLGHPAALRPSSAIQANSAHLVSWSFSLSFKWR